MKLPKRGLQEVQLQRTGYRSFRDVAFSIVEQISRRLRRLFQVLSEAGDEGQERSRPPRSALSLSSLRVDLSQQACPASVGLTALGQSPCSVLLYPHRSESP